jgi:hypothetical protein
MLSQSVTSVQQALGNNIKGALLTAIHQFSLYEKETYATETSITDWVSHIEKTVEYEAK